VGGLNELQSIEIDMLEKFSDICKRENLTWFAMFGTLLGATRHGGFIPWDDDIDVAMPRADYDRLRKQPELFQEPYFLQTPQNDPAAAPHFLKLRRSDTTLMDKISSLTRGGNMGVYIDILPLDEVPNAKAAIKLHSRAKLMQKQMLATAALDESAGSELPDFKAAYCYGNGGIEGCYALLSERYEWLCSMYDGEPYYAIPVIMGQRGCRVFDKAWFKSNEMMSFEHLEVPVPTGWREILVACYPNGLLELQESERETRELKYVDMSRSYVEYVSRYADMLKDIEGKKILIFGAGDSLRIWLERHSQGVEAVCAFDNSEGKWGKKAYGVTIRPPGEIPSMIGSDTRLIIASIWHDEIAKQLEGMGIHDYYIFIDGWNYRRD